MRVRLQRGQLVRVIAAPPAVEALPADAEMATGEGCVAPVVQVVIHPLKPLNRIAAQLPPGAHKLAGTGWLSPSNLHGDTLLRVSPIILNENSARTTENVRPLSSFRKAIPQPANQCSAEVRSWRCVVPSRKWRIRNRDLSSGPLYPCFGGILVRGAFRSQVPISKCPFLLMNDE